MAMVRAVAPMYIIGLDIGTSSCKVLALDPEGNMLSSAVKEYDNEFPRQDWVEVDPNKVWEAAVWGLSQVVREVEDAKRGSHPLAIGISVSGDEVFPLDSRGNPLYNTIMSADARGHEELSRVLMRIGPERIREITGLPPSHKYGINRMAWFAANMPDVFRLTRRFVTWEDFIAGRLTGRHACSASAAARLMCFDIGALAWSAPILEAAGIETRFLPEVVMPGAVIGEVLPEALPGIPSLSGVRVIAGGFDQACAALGAGVVEPGIAGVGTGTMESTAFFSSVRLDGLPYPANPSLTGDGFVYTVTNPSGGATLRWFRDNFGMDEVIRAEKNGLNPYDLLTSEMYPGVSGVLVIPHFAGAGAPARDPLSSACIMGLRLSTTRSQVIKGLLEGVTFELRTAIRSFTSEAGQSVAEVRATGGGSKSTQWLQLKADVLGTHVRRMKISDASALGAAVMAATGAGLFGGPREAVAAMVKPDLVFEPDPVKTKAYDRLFDIYSSIYPSISTILHQLAEESGIAAKVEGGACANGPHPACGPARSRCLQR